MIYAEIKQARIEALKSKNRPVFDVLTYLQGEMERGEKVTSDAQALKVLKKVFATYTEIGDALGMSITGQLVEKHTLEQLSDAQIKDIIKKEQLRSIGEAQKFFKTKFAGQYEGQTVTRLHKEVQDEST